MGLAVSWNLIVQLDSVFQDIGIVFLHEPALGHVVVGDVREPGVLPRFLEPAVSFLELLVGVVDVSHRVPGRGSVVRVWHLFPLGEDVPGLVQVPFLEEGVTMLEHELGDLVLVKDSRFDLVEFISRGFVIFPVEKVQAVIKTDLGDEFGIRTVSQIVGDSRLVTVFLKADGTESLVASGEDITCLIRDLVENDARALKHPVVVEVEGFAVASRQATLSGNRHSRQKDHHGEKRRFDFVAHNDILRKFIVLTHNPQIY